MNDLMGMPQDTQELYEEYEALLLRRDQLIRESGSYETRYLQEFGDMIADNFRLKIECIKTKKQISYCRRWMNRGLAIDVDAMKEEVEKEMELYNHQLQEMLEENEDAKKSKEIGSFQYNRAKKLYRKLAKLIHPDINSKTKESHQLQELWVRVEQAYMRSDVDALEDLEALTYKAMEELGDDSFEIDYNGIEDRIERLEGQINDILSTTPYTYGEILKDPDKKKAHKDALNDEKNDFEHYLKELKKTLEDMLKGGGLHMIWKMN